MELPKMQNSVIESSETPSYLEILHESNTILVRKRNQENGNGSLGTYKNNGAEDLNLTGNPLENPFAASEDLDIPISNDISTVSWRKNEENHFPFKISDAINFLSTYNLGYKGSHNSENKTVWVALDSKDFRKTTLMGFLIKGDWRIRKTVCQNKIPLDGLQAYGYRVREKHLSMSGAKENKSRSKVSMVYDIVSKSPKINDDDEDNVVSIKLQSNWKPSLNDIASPPPKSNTTLSVEMKIGSKQSKISHLWNQLVFLNGLVAITSRKEVALPETVLMRVDTMQRVIDMLKAKDSFEVKFGGLVVNDDQYGTVAEIIQGEQDTRDFPSKLWELFICCQSCNELVECFEYVFEEAEKGTIVPYVHPQNKSKFSDLIMDLCMGNALPKYFTVNESRALDMLKEMGFNALERSYTHILLTSDWCSSYQLDNDIPKFNHLARLGHLHILLDLFLTIQQYMNLSIKCVQSLFSVAIVKFLEKFRSFGEALENTEVEFSHAVRTTDVTVHLTKHFTSWKLEIETDPQNVDLILSTICYVSKDSIFPPPLALPELEDATGKHDANSLFTAQLTVIGNKIINNFATK